MNPLLSALTASGIITADVAAMVDRQMSPLDAQLYAEQIMLTAFRDGLKAQEIRYLDLVNAANGKPPEQQLAMFWEDENAALYRSVESALVQIASDRAVSISIATGGADMWAVVNEEIIDWIGEYYQSFDPTFVGSIPNLNITSRTLVGQALIDWQRGELEAFGAADGLPQLIRALEPAFGVKRAETIAVTETTRVFSESTIAAGRANPLITRYRWYTVAGTGVCPTCGPLHNTLSGENKSNPTWQHPAIGTIAAPPAHPNCRCQAVPETDVTLQFDSDLPRPYTWSPETPAEYAKRRRDELNKTRPPKPPKARPPEATLPPVAPPEPPKVPPAEVARGTLKTINDKAVAQIAEVQSEIDALDVSIKEFSDTKIKPLVDRIVPLEYGTPEWEKLHTEIGALQAERKKFYDAQTDKYWKINALRKASLTEQRATVAVDNPTSIKVNAAKGSRKEKAAMWEKGADNFSKLVSETVVPTGSATVDFASTTSSQVRGISKDRSFYSSGRGVFMSPTSTDDVVVHELGHWLEDVNPQLHDAALKFYDRRTTGESVAWMGTGYGKTEVTRKDKFIHPYMGKDYGRAATEIVSMGLEYFYEAPLKLATDDPDYFDFIFNLVRGIW